MFLRALCQSGGPPATARRRASSGSHRGKGPLHLTSAAACRKTRDCRRPRFDPARSAFPFGAKVGRIAVFPTTICGADVPLRTGRARQSGSTASGSQPSVRARAKRRRFCPSRLRPHLSCTHKCNRTCPTLVFPGEAVPSPARAKARFSSAPLSWRVPPARAQTPAFPKAVFLRRKPRIVRIGKKKQTRPPCTSSITWASTRRTRSGC